MRTAIASVWAVIVCTFFVQMANALQTDLISLRADTVFSAGIVGSLLAAYYVGFTLAPLVGRVLIGRFGHVNAVLACVLVAAAVIVAHPFVVSAPAWALFRVVSGFVLSLSYVAVESWINERVDNVLRGRVFSFYMFAQMAGMTIAQSLLHWGDAVRPPLYLLSAVLFGAAAVAIGLARRGAPAGVPPKPLGLVKLFRISPLGAGATVLAGLSWSITFTFGAVYAKRIGLDLSGIGWFMGLAVAAGGATQVPLGWLSDVIGRRPVIGLMFGCGFAAALFGVWAHGPLLAFVAAGLVGGCVFPVYAVSAATLNDHIASETRVAAAAGLVLLFGIGSIFGPLVCGWTIAAVGAAGFFALLAATMGAGLVLALLVRR